MISTVVDTQYTSDTPQAMDKENSASALPRFGGQKSGWTFPHSDVTSRILSAAIHAHRQPGG